MSHQLTTNAYNISRLRTERFDDEGQGLRMNRLRVHLENCYGIRSLDHEFDFSQKRAWAIYAPNGCMKSSLALTFKDMANVRDRVHLEAKSVCSVVDENGKQLSQADIVVLEPYKEPLQDTANATVLLANSKLREQYTAVNSDREKAQESLVKVLKKEAKCKEVERELVKAFLAREPETSFDFCVALGRLERELKDQEDTPYANVPYDTVFDERVLQLLQDGDVKTVLDDFVAKYDESISRSVFFRKGTFEYYNASEIAKHLESQGFFKAKHFVTLNGKQRVEITSKSQLEDLIETEREQISNDANLRAAFEKLDDRINKNSTFRDFRAYVMSNQAVLVRMKDGNNFKQEVWKSYLKKQEALVGDLMGKYDAAKRQNAEIFEQARQERTYWEQVIETFNYRFSIPVELRVRNREGLVGGDEDRAELSFLFKDEQGRFDIQRGDLLKILSQGEKKALYILDILFDIQVRQNNNQETLFVVDDIADSFDYRNKYAIIHYLMEIIENPLFKMVILTHNFDFFRTSVGRFVGNGQCLVACRNDGAITIEKAPNVDNIFIKEWKSKFPKDNKIRIASISFMRNLIEYTKTMKDRDFLTLTALLHWSPKVTGTIRQGDLNAIYSTLFSLQPMKLEVADEPVMDTIGREVKECLHAAPGINLEHKIVLSIAIRIAAERFMVAKLNDDAFVEAITKNQTHVLLEAFKKKFPMDPATQVLNKVLIMTPENIHLNAFMYEPIVDMLDDHLKTLYNEVKALN